ncbi:D-2-hydroxyacid dehydrogenase, partial [Candidatus Bathyarchaeota archaeon]|nr:D-2-hydroxyacid dehydrogenase [Candidatus Bathyarchaeota archaeon]
MTKVKTLITFHIAQELLEKIKGLPDIEVMYDPSLLGKPRYQNDQHGAPINRTQEQKKKLTDMMKETEVLFGYVPSEYQRDIKLHFPRLRWMQSASAGIGWRAKSLGWTETDIDFTSSSGIHSTPLAEFCLMTMLMKVKDYNHIAEEKQRKHWQRTCTTELKGKTLAIIGLGRVGGEIARLSRSFGVQVLATKRHIEGIDPASVNVDNLYPHSELKQMLGIADFVALIVPETQETRGLLGKEEIAMMKKGAYLINISRGSAVDEPALIEALQSGHLSGAALDVFWEEPLPEDSPFWDIPNVIVSPHSASTADTENTKLTEIFIDNYHRYIEAKPLRNL